MSKPRTLAELPSLSAAQHGDKPCILHPDDDSGISYAELDRRSAAFAAMLHARGVRPGDRVAIAFNNRAIFFVALFGAARAGVAAVPLDHNLAPRELAAILAHATPALIVVTTATEAKLRSVDASLPLYVLGEAPLPEAAAPEIAVQPDDVCLILYTSGTTGAPKGVVHTHSTILAKVDVITRWFSFDPSFRSLCMLPTHFGHGLVCNCLSTLFYGGTLVLCPPFDVGLIGRLWSIVERLEVNTFSSVPTIVRLLLKAAERNPPATAPRLRFVTCASAPLGKPEVEKFEATFGAPLLNCYGITETASWTAFSPPTGPRDRASIGTMFGCEIRASDPEGRPLPAGESGELQVRGPSVMRGYYQAPDLTQAALRDGWFRTGDQGYVDAEGRVFLLGRIKELIIRAGLNIYPAEVDSALLSHPAVAEAYAVGLEDAILGEKVGACVVLKEGTSATPAELIAHARGQLAAYKCPERLVLVDAIPKTSRGKVNRARLRPLFESAA